MMFGIEERHERLLQQFEKLQTQISMLGDRLDQLIKVNEDAIINKQVITKFMDDLHKITAMAHCQPTLPQSEPIPKKKGRPKRHG